jgi:excisionase family DNA binding protein
MELLTRRQVAELLQVSTRQLDRFIVTGLPVVRLNSSVRIRKEDLRKWMGEQG